MNFVQDSSGQWCLCKKSGRGRSKSKKHHADLYEFWLNDKLHAGNIYVPGGLQGKRVRLVLEIVETPKALNNSKDLASKEGNKNGRKV